MKQTGIAVFAIAAMGIASGAFAQDAKVLYGQKCGSCHGPDGKGETAMGKKLGLKSIAGMDAVKAAKITADGVGKMPAYKGKLTDKQIKEISEYTAGLK
jgi:cytochrome c6